MPISMQPSARYVTQSSIFDNMYLGPLTNRKIDRYTREGKYGPAGQLALLRSEVKIKRIRNSQSASRKKKFESLFAQFDT